MQGTRVQSQGTTFPHAVGQPSHWAHAPQLESLCTMAKGPQDTMQIPLAAVRLWLLQLRPYTVERVNQSINNNKKTHKGMSIVSSAEVVHLGMFLDRGWDDGWMVSLTRWTWVWVNSGSWWWTGRPGVLWFMELQRVGHDWVTELNWTIPDKGPFKAVLFRLQRGG